MKNNQEMMAKVNDVVMAGMRLMYDPKTVEFFKQGITRDDPLPDILYQETAGLMVMLFEKSKSRMPKSLIEPAAVLLLAEIARFMTQAGLAKPTEEDISSAVTKLRAELRQRYGDKAPQQQPQGGAPQQPQEGSPPQQVAPPAGIMGA